MINILSIDWDYFYPDSANYDWGARESDYFYSFMWSLRVADVNLITQVPALKEYVPKVRKDFWQRMVSNKPILYVTDSHKDIVDVITEESIVTNLDAHHDFGYKEYKELGCDNWANLLMKSGLIKEYHLIYPAWRQSEDESENFSTIKSKITSVSYQLPKKQDYDIIFICRSGAWTPPWHDKLFFQFVDMTPHDMRTHIIIKPREFDLKQAIRNEKIMYRKIMNLRSSDKGLSVI